MKRPYEITTIFRIMTEEETRAAIDQCVNWIEEEEKGKVTKIDRNMLGRRKLAYEIDGQRDGLYIVVYADVEPSHLNDLELNLRLFNPLLRYLVIRDEEGKYSTVVERPEEEEAAAEEETEETTE